MEDYLYQKDLFVLLGRKENKSTSMKDEEWEVIDRKELGTIRLCLAVSVAFNISKEMTMKDLMNALAKKYEKPSASNKVFQLKRLFNMKMSEGGSLTNHLNEFNMVNNQLSYVVVDFDDEVRDLIILCPLPEIWNGLVMVVSNFVFGSNTLKFDDVVGVILGEEMRWKITGETLGNVLIVENRGRQNEIGKSSGNCENYRKGTSKFILGKIEC
jgi:hypothetical protein